MDALNENKLYLGNCLYKMDIIPDKSVDLVFYSPPYWNLHKYGECKGEIGYGQTLGEYISSMEMVAIGCERVLKDDGNLVVNIMDLVRNNTPIMLSNIFIEKFSKHLNFVERIVWFIRNKMPVASDVRFVNKMEWILHFSKKQVGYYFDKDSVREEHSEYALKDKRTWKWNAKGKCPGNMWDIPAYRVSGKNNVHVAEFPIELCERVIKCWSKEGDTVLDPFMGSGTTGVACKNLNRKFIGIEKEEKYFNIAKERLKL